MLTYEEMDARLRELKSTNVPRASLARIDTTESYARDKRKWSEVVPPELHAPLDAYLRHFAWLERPRAASETKRVCPGCDTRGGFSWGVVHGKCSCGWPGTLLHRVYDDSDSAVCERCAKRKDEHDVAGFDLGAVAGIESLVRREYRCPRGALPIDANDPSRHFAQLWLPPTILKFDVLLWAHPYEVHLPKEASR